MTSEHGSSGAVGGSPPTGPVGMPAAQYETQVVVTTRTLWRGVGVILATLAGLWAVSQAGPDVDAGHLPVLRHRARAGCQPLASGVGNGAPPSGSSTWPASSSWRC